MDGRKVAIDSVALANNPENPQTCGYMELCDLLRPGWHLPSEADWMTLIETAGGRGSVFSGVGVQANFLSASDVDGLIVREYKTVYGLHLDNAQFELGDSFDKSYGYSIRCLKD